MDAADRRMLREIDEVKDKLTAWETKFIYGDPDRPRSGLVNFEVWTDRQREVFVQVYEEKVLDKRSGRSKKRQYNVEYPHCRAVKTGRGWQIHVKGRPVGRPMTKPEASVITAWLNSVIEHGNELVQQGVEDAPEEF